MCTLSASLHNSLATCRKLLARPGYRIGKAPVFDPNQWLANPNNRRFHYVLALSTTHWWGMSSRQAWAALSLLPFFFFCALCLLCTCLNAYLVCCTPLQPLCAGGAEGSWPAVQVNFSTPAPLCWPHPSCSHVAGIGFLRCWRSCCSANTLFYLCHWAGCSACPANVCVSVCVCECVCMLVLSHRYAPTVFLELPNPQVHLTVSAIVCTSFTANSHYALSFEIWYGILRPPLVLMRGEAPCSRHLSRRCFPKERTPRLHSSRMLLPGDPPSFGLFTCFVCVLQRCPLVGRCFPLYVSYSSIGATLTDVRMLGERQVCTTQYVFTSGHAPLCGTPVSG